MAKKLLLALAFAVALVLVFSIFAAARQTSSQVLAYQSGPASSLSSARFPGELQFERAPLSPAEPRGDRPLAPTGVDFRRASTTELGLTATGLERGPFQESYFFDDMEVGPGAWAASGMWHLADTASAYPNTFSGSASWWYGQESTGTYDNSLPNSGYLQTGPITIPVSAPAAYLRFYSWEFTEDLGTTHDTRKVYTSPDGTTWTEQFQSSESTANWHEVQVNLSALIGTSFYLRFEFTADDGSYNFYPGWYLDDVAVGYDPLHVESAAQVGYGLPGDSINYPVAGRLIRLTNHTPVSTVITATTSSVWPALFDVPMGSLDPGVSADMAGTVDVPLAALPGSYVDITRQYTSWADPTISNTQVLRAWVGKLALSNFDVIDDGSGQSSGNGDGRIDPGETIELYTELQNNFDRTAYSVYAILDSTPAMTWLDNQVGYGDIPEGATAPPQAPFVFTVPEGTPPGSTVDFSLMAFGYNLASQNNLSLTVPFAIRLNPSGIGFAAPGTTLTYTLLLENYSGVDDAFTFTTTGNTWSTGVTPNPTGLVANGASLPVDVLVTVPEAEPEGGQDTLTVTTAGSQTPASEISAVASLTTTATCLAAGTSPVTMEDLEAVYTAQPLNLYLFVFSSDNDTLDAALDGYNWSTGLWETIALQSGGGSGVLFDGPVDPAYTSFRVDLNDTEDNDQIYYDYEFVNCPVVVFRPEEQTRTAAPGNVLTYTQTVQNLTELDTTLELTVTGNAWPTTLVSGSLPLSQTPVLAHSESFTFEVRVEIPGSADPLAIDAPSVYAFATVDPTRNGNANLTTAAMPAGWQMGFVSNVEDATSTDFEAYFDPLTGTHPTRLTYDRNDQGNLSISAFANPDTPAAWEFAYMNPQGQNVREVRWARLDASGALAAGPFVVTDFSGTFDDISDETPSIAIDPVSGVIGLVWRRFQPSASLPFGAVYTALYEPDGSVVLPPTRLSPAAPEPQENYDPVIEAFRSGGFGIAWQHYSLFTGYPVVYFGALNSSGVVHTPFAPLDFGGFFGNSAHLVQLQDNNLLVLNSSLGGLMGSYRVYYGVLDRNGDFVAGPTSLDEASTSYQEDSYPDAVQLANGNVVVGWLRYDEAVGDLNRLTFNILGPDYEVLTSTVSLPYPDHSYNYDLSMARAADGEVVFVWESECFSGCTSLISTAVIAPDGSVLLAPIPFREGPGSANILAHNGTAAGGQPAQPLFIQLIPFVSKE